MTKKANTVELSVKCPFTKTEIAKATAVIKSGTSSIATAQATVLDKQKTMADKLRDYSKTVKGRALLEWAILPYCQSKAQRDATDDLSRDFYNLRNTLNSERIMGKGKAYTIATAKCAKDSDKNLTEPPKLVKCVKAESGSGTAAERIKFSTPIMVTPDRAVAEWNKVLHKLPLSMLAGVLELSDVELKASIAKLFEDRATKERSERSNNNVADIKSGRAKAKPAVKKKTAKKRGRKAA